MPEFNEHLNEVILGTPLASPDSCSKVFCKNYPEYLSPSTFRCIKSGIIYKCRTLDILYIHWIILLYLNLLLFIWPRYQLFLEVEWIFFLLLFGESKTWSYSGYHNLLLKTIVLKILFNWKCRDFILILILYLAF